MRDERERLRERERERERERKEKEREKGGEREGGRISFASEFVKQTIVCFMKY